MISLCPPVTTYGHRARLVELDSTIGVYDKRMPTDRVNAAIIVATIDCPIATISMSPPSPIALCATEDCAGHKFCVRDAGLAITSPRSVNILPAATIWETKIAISPIWKDAL